MGISQICISQKNLRILIFIFEKKKKALHRILFINFKDDLNEDEYIKFTCKNAGYCCSLNCMKKYKYKGVSNYINEVSSNQKDDDVFNFTVDFM
jgi:hypothetical protein